jgi:hypothetical protein
VDSSVSGLGSVEGSYEKGNETLVFINCEGLIDYVSDCLVLK